MSSDHDETEDQNQNEEEETEEETPSLDEIDTSHSSSDLNMAGDLGGPSLQSTVFTMNRMLGVESDVDLDAKREEKRESMEEEDDDDSTFSFGEKYLVSGKLGEGRMGVVLDARDIDIRRDIAIKLINEEDNEQQEWIERFMEEAQVQGQLEHPNIPPVYEMGMEQNSRVYFSMQKVEGDSLREILDGIRKEDPSYTEEYTLTRLLQIFHKICDGLAFAHSRGVIHRDLKPGNIMIGAYGEVHLMDWGLAKIIDREDPHKKQNLVVSDRMEGDVLHSMSGSVIGTPAYMSPEQAEGKVDQLDERADIYALGGILYRMLTLNPPIYEDDMEKALMRVKNNDILPPSEQAPDRTIPTELEEVVLKAMSGAREDRYQTVSALQEDIRAFQEGRTLEAASYNPIQIAWKWMLLHRTASVSTAVMLVLLAGFLGYRRYEKAQTYHRYRNQAVNARKQQNYEKSAQFFRRAATVQNEPEMKKQARLMEIRTQLQTYRKQVQKAEKAMADKHYQEALKRFERAEELQQTLNTGTLLEQGWITKKSLSKLRKRRREAQQKRTLKQAQRTMAQAEETIRKAEQAEERKKKLTLLRTALHKIWEAVEQVPEKKSWHEKLEQLSRRVSSLKMAHLSEELHLLTELFRRIRKLEKQGKSHDPLFRKASSLIKKLKRRDSADALWMAGLLRFRLGQDQRAIHLYQQVLDKKQDHKLALVGLGHAFIERGIARMFLPVYMEHRRQEFLNEGRRMIEQGADHLERAQKQGRPDLFLRVRGSYLKTYMQSHVQLAPLYHLLGKRRDQELQNQLTKRMKKKGQADQTNLQYLRGIFHLLQGDQQHSYRKAIQHFSDVVEDRPGNYRAQYWLGVSYLSAGNSQQAIRRFTRATEINSRYWIGYFSRGIVRQQQKAYEDAIADYQQTIKLRPEFVSAYINRGFARKEQGQLKQARSDFNKALSLQPKSPVALNNRGITKLAQGHIKSAIDDFHKTLELYPDFAEAYVHLGMARQKQNRPDKALQNYNKALEADPKLAKAYYNRGQVHRSQDNIDQALSDFTKTLELDPKNARAYVSRGIIRQEEGDLEAAIDDYSQAIQYDPSYPGAYYNRGNVRYKQGDTEGAKQDFRKALQVAPEDWPPRDRLKNALEKLNKRN